MAFNDEIKKCQEDIDLAVEEVIAKISFAVFSAVTLATPVGDPRLWQNPENAPPGYVGGRARGNWQIGIGADPEGEGDDPPDPTGSRVLDTARAELAGYEFGTEKIFIVNNVPYIGPLNNGSSAQAPAGFVEKATQAAVNAAEQGLSGL
ncbi:MAG: hypothetical protein V3W44_10155 [Dehalococcoidales bacterium]